MQCSEFFVVVVGVGTSHHDKMNCMSISYIVRMRIYYIQPKNETNINVITLLGKHVFRSNDDKLGVQHYILDALVSKIVSSKKGEKYLFNLTNC